MGLFGSSGGDTSSDGFASKLRSSGGGELDLSYDPGASSIGGDTSSSLGAGSDIQQRIAMEQQKMELMTQVKQLFRPSIVI